MSPPLCPAPKARRCRLISRQLATKDANAPQIRAGPQGGRIFRADHGCLVWVCEKNIYVGTHKDKDIVATRSFPLDVPIALKASTRIELRVSGDTVTVMHGSDKVGAVRLTDPGIDSGKVFHVHDESHRTFQVRVPPVRDGDDAIVIAMRISG